MDQYNWVDQFDLLLFDFDGLLVDTEELHYRAYKELCQHYGETLHWSFEKYANIALVSSEKLQQSLRDEVPGLFIKEPSWIVLYDLKKSYYNQLLQEGQLQLLPGVEALLEELNERGTPRAIVTHSPRAFVEFIATRLPSLETIPLWIARENYDLPKPAPDPYLKALEIFEIPAERAVGFEDSPRGLEALQRAGIPAVLINRMPHPSLQKQKVAVFDSFCSIPQEGPFAAKGSGS